jgi:spermidine synthase
VGRQPAAGGAHLQWGSDVLNGIGDKGVMISLSRKQRRTPDVRRPLLLLVCTVSGFSALVCELVWSRMLVPVFGNTVAATSLVTCVFMAGLALGGYWGGRRAGSVRDLRQALATYALLEAGIGLSAVLFPYLMMIVAPLVRVMATVAGGSPWSANLVRLLFFFVLLLPPTFLMGATFPVIGSAFTGGGRHTGHDAALVYGFNTLGGTIGVLASGFVLIQWLGGRGSLFTAGGLSLTLSLLVAWAARSGHARRMAIGGQPAERAADPADGPLVPETVEGLRPALAGAALAGFCALAYEVLWTRLLVLVLQNSVYAFALILSGFLAGITAGSLLAAPLRRCGWRPLKLFGILQLLTGLACLLVPLGFSLPQRPGELSYLSFLLARPLFLVLLPMVLSGTLVPLSVAIVRDAGAGVGRAMGDVYAANALGAAAGALAAGFVLVPILGTRMSILLLFALQLFFGLYVFSSGRRRIELRLALTVAGLTLVAAAFFFLPPDLVRRQYRQAAEADELLLFTEGRVGTTSITRNSAGNLILYLNGIPEVTNDRPAMRTFRLMALLPYLLHPEPENALMITFGAGISAGLAVHLFDRVDCVELNEICPRIARFYEKENRRVMAAPNLTLHINDGRNYLLQTGKRHSVIISDATHPHSYDSWILFTREFYRLCRDRLDDDGVFCQWLPLHGLAPGQFRIILNTVRYVFPELSLWQVDNAYCLMLAGKRPLHIVPQRLADLLNREELRPFLSPLGLDNPYVILKCFVTDRSGLDRLLQNEALINTDDRPYNQFFPLSATGFGRLEWPTANLRQLMQCRQDASFIMGCRNTN